MSWWLLLLVGVPILWAITLAYMVIKKKNDDPIFTVGILGVMLVFALLFISGMIPVRDTHTLMHNPEIVKTNSLVIVNYNNTYYVREDAKFYNNTSKEPLYLREHYNSWGFCIQQEPVLSPSESQSARCKYIRE